MSAPSTAFIPALPARYTYVKELGAGATSQVVLARDEALGRLVAIKCQRGALPPELALRWQDEARVMARLDHPGIAMVYDSITDERGAYLVMEYVKGATVAEARQRWTPQQVTELAMELADALAAVHAAGIIHRDLKPSNVLLTPLGRVKLTDFGIASSALSTHHTQTGLLVGTPQYLAPEQLLGEPITAAVDVYALGLVVRGLLAGEQTELLSSAETLARRAAPPAVPPGLPAPWGALLPRLLSAEPSARPTAARLALELRAAPAAVAPASHPSATRVLGPVAAQQLLGHLRAPGRPAARARLGAPRPGHLLAASMVLALLALLAPSHASAPLPAGPQIAPLQELHRELP